MEKDPLTAIVMATMIEAKPFVTGMSMQQIEKKPIVIFRKDNIILAISGIGKTNAAIATTYCCQRFNPAAICNLGAAGAADLTHRLGDVFHIIKIIEHDRPELTSEKPTIHQPDILDGFLTATLSTSDRAILDPGERRLISENADLMDMEGASVAHACRIFETKCYIFKFVSDTPEHTEDNDIIQNIRLYRTPFYQFFNRSIIHRIQHYGKSSNS